MKWMMDKIEEWFPEATTGLKLVSAIEDETWHECINYDRAGTGSVGSEDHFYA